MVFNFEQSNVISINLDNDGLKANTNLEFDAGILIGDISPNTINGIKSADLDKDGNKDVITCSSDGKIYIWKNPGGTGVKSNWTNYLVGNTQGAALRVEIGDLDKDNDIDIVSTDQTGKNVTIWENDGNPFDGTPWTSVWVGDTAGQAFAVKLGDINGDSYLDIVTGDASTGGTVTVWWNDGTPALQSQWDNVEVGDTTSSILSLTVADLDRDNLNDIISGDANSELRGWRNPGAPWDTWNYTLFGIRGGPNFNSLEAGDLDNDNNIDIVTADSGGWVIGWRNNGLPWNSWNSFVFDQSMAEAFFIVLEDMNRDGYLDIASGHDAGTFYAWTNMGNPWIIWNGYKVKNGTTDILVGTANFITRSKVLDLVIGTEGLIILYPNLAEAGSGGSLFSLDAILIAASILIAGIAIAIAIIYHARSRPTESVESSPRSKPKITPRTKTP